MKKNKDNEVFKEFLNSFDTTIFFDQLRVKSNPQIKIIDYYELKKNDIKLRSYSPSIERDLLYSLEKAKSIQLEKSYGEEADADYKKVIKQLENFNRTKNLFEYYKISKNTILRLNNKIKGIDDNWIVMYKKVIKGEMTVDDIIDKLGMRNLTESKILGLKL